MRQHAMRSLSLIAITLALPLWVEAAELVVSAKQRGSLRAETCSGDSRQVDGRSFDSAR